MRFIVYFVPSAKQDLAYFQIREQRIILDAVKTFLEIDAAIPGKRRKQLRLNPLAPWELRIGNYRIFYEIRPEARVRILAIGHKQHNELFIQGKRIDI